MSPRNAGAGGSNVRTLVGLLRPRWRALSRFTAPSEVSTTLPAPPAAATARAAIASAPGTARRQAGSATMIGIPACPPGRKAGPRLLPGSIALLSRRRIGYLPPPPCVPLAPLVAGRCVALIVRLDNAGDQRMAHHVARFQPGNSNARHAFQGFQRITQAGTLA